MDYTRFSHVLMFLGAVFTGVIVLEILFTLLSPLQIEMIAIVNIGASFPFILALVVGGYWLSTTDFSTERYPRMAGWTLAMGGFFFVFFTLIAVLTANATLAQVGIVRWGASAGTGIGAVIGILEARAIEREVIADRIRIRNEELQRQRDNLEEFANIVSHDLRNPLNVASGYTEILQEEYDHKGFERVTSAHERMERIIEELLTLARSGQFIDEPAPVALSTLVERTWGNVETAQTTLETEELPTIIADADRLEHVFENLFRNAVEHGGDDVTIRIGTLSDGFYVEDDGTGIPEEDRKSVLESGYTTNQGGTGFGLAIVQQIVSAHGWNLHVTTGTDGGARFEITGVEFPDE